MKFIFSVSTALLTCVSMVKSHGSVSALRANGKTWGGPLPGSGNKMDSPIRQISTLEPLIDPYSPSMSCGPGAASSAPAVANVTAGSRIEFAWTSGGSMNWPHRYGPVMTYAYHCPGSDARACKPPSDAQWFLLQADGFDKDPNSVPAGSNPARTGWVQDRFRAGQRVGFNIPKSMPNGPALLRHEIIGLHVAETSRGAEYYVSCSQINVSGGSSRSAKTQGADLAKFPGEYYREHKGLKVNVFDSNLKASNYLMPGPKLFTGTREPASSSSSPRPTSTRTSTPATTSTHTSTSAPHRPVIQPPSSSSGASGAPVPTKRPLKRCPAKRNKRDGELSVEKRMSPARHLSRAFKRDLTGGSHA